MFEDSEFNILQVVGQILALMIAIIGHEIMHGLMAYKYGDDTAKKQGRLSINPIVHIDLIGTILLPAILFISGAPFLFGWAKPVPVRMDKVVQSGGYIAGFWVSMAGIVYNLFLAFMAFSIFSSFPFDTNAGFESFIGYTLIYLVVYNIVLAVFNLWPIPPLDGANAISFLGLRFGIKKIYELNQKIGIYGMIIIIVILSIPQISAIFFAPVEIILKTMIG